MNTPKLNVLEGKGKFFSTSSLAAVSPAVSAKFVLEYNLRKSSIWKMSNVTITCSNHPCRIYPWGLDRFRKMFFVF